MRTWQARRMVVVLAAVAMLALGGSVVLAAIPSGGGMIYACYNKTTGAMRVVNYPTVRCASSERLLSWTQVGPKAPPLASIGIKTFEMNSSNVEFTAQDGTTVLSLWAETGSNKQECLASLGEARLGVFPANIYCASRTVRFADGTSHAGVYLHLFLVAPPDPDFAYWVNVYQEGAKFYGAPRKCDLPGCND